MKVKEIKNYSGRLRINIVQSDGFKANEDVILMSVQEYDDIKDSILELQNQITVLSNENAMLNEMETKLRKGISERESQIDDLLKIALQPIQEHYEIEIQKRDDTINEKDKELNNIKAVLNRFTTSMSGLSFIDFIRSKHKKLINDFHDSIWVNVPMDQVQDVEKIESEK